MFAIQVALLSYVIYIGQASMNKFTGVVFAVNFLLHMKFQVEGTLTTNGPFYGQLGGVIPLMLMTLLCAYVNYLWSLFWSMFKVWLLWIASGFCFRIVPYKISCHKSLNWYSDSSVDLCKPNLAIFLQIFYFCNISASIMQDFLHFCHFLFIHAILRPFSHIWCILIFSLLPLSKEDRLYKILLLWLLFLSKHHNHHFSAFLYKIEFVIFSCCFYHCQKWFLIQEDRIFNTFYHAKHSNSDPWKFGDSSYIRYVNFPAYVYCAFMYKCIYTYVWICKYMCRYECWYT